MVPHDLIKRKSCQCREGRVDVSRLELLIGHDNAVADALQDGLAALSAWARTSAVRSLT